MASARTILLAEEDPATAGFLADNLIADGYRVLVADDKTAASSCSRSSSLTSCSATSTATRCT